MMCFCMMVIMWRDRRRTAALFAPGFLAFLLAALSVADMFLPKPYDGVILDSDHPGSSIVHAVVPGSGAEEAGIKQGDIILGIDRQVLSGLSSAQSILSRHHIGETIPYLVRSSDKDQVSEVHVRLGRRSIWDSSYLYAVLLGFAFFAVGSFVLLRQPALPVSRIFFNMCALFLLFLVCRLRPASYSWVDSLVLTTGTAALLLLPAVFLHFFLIFPRPIWQWRRDPLARIVAAMAARSKHLLPLYLIPPIVYAGAVVWTRFKGIELPLISGAPITNWWVMVIYMVLGLGALGVSATRLPDPRQRHGAMIVFVGTFFGVLPFVVLAVGFPSFLHTERFLSYGVGPLILVPVTFAYAIVRFQLLNIRVILRKSLLYTVTTAFITAIYALAIAFANHVFHGTAFAASIYFPILFALAIVLLFEPLRQRLQGPVDRFFFSERHRLQEAMVGLGEAMTEETELGPIVTKLAGRLPEILHLNFAALYIIRKDRLFRVAGPQSLPPDLPAAPILFRHLRHHGSLLRTKELGPIRLLSAELDELGRLFSEMGVEIIALLATSRRTVGLMLLSESAGQTTLEHEEEELLRSLLHQASLVLETGLLLEEKTHQAELERELKIASSIQASLLPRELRPIPGWKRAARCLPAREVGGDFFSEIPCPSGLAGAIVYGDVSGKSISGALMMMAAHEIINAIALGHPDAEELLRLSNERLYGMRDRSGHPEAGRFVALGYLGFPENSGRLHYGLAGQPPPLVLRHSGTVEVLPLPPHRVPLGALNLSGRRMLSTDIEPGELIIGYSDGITEARSPSGTFYGEERLKTVLLRCPGLDPDEVIGKIIADVEDFSGGTEPYDDITLVAALKI